MKKQYLYFFLSLFLVTTKAWGQNKRIDSLLFEILKCQQSVTDANYQQGMFSSQRVYLSRKKPSWEDDNIFFTSLIVWVLKSSREHLSTHNQRMVDSICQKAAANYYRYRNKDGKPVYNFWQTTPSRHFPNSKYFSSKKKYIIPDDLDDTAIIYLSEDASDSLKKIVKQMMAENANGQKKTIRNTFKKYKHTPAYSTWFGKNMPVEFDLSVQTNVLCFVLDNRYALNKFDSATINLIRNMVISGEYMKRPAYISPQYQNCNVILYNLSRLVAAHPQQKDLYNLKPLLLKDIYKQMKTAQNGMDQLLLQTSLMRLQAPVEKRTLVSNKDMDNFYFFVANMTSVFPNPIKGIFTKSRKTNFYYKSRPYYLALMLENEVLRLNYNETY